MRGAADSSVQMMMMMMMSCFSHSPPPPLLRHHLEYCSSPPAASAPKALVEIQRSKLIACLRATDANVAVEAARAALSNGISVLEITMPTPGVMEIIQCLSKEYPSSIIGAGTVLKAEDARRAIKAGARFLMSPCTIEEILHDLRDDAEVLYIPGAMTPTEVFLAHSNGARLVKIYPVSVLGGVRYMSAVKKPFPEVGLLASQGVTIGLMGQYIKGGASAVVLSDALFDKEAMERQDLEEISRLARLASLQVQ